MPSWPLEKPATPSKNSTDYLRSYVAHCNLRKPIPACTPLRTPPGRATSPPGAPPGRSESASGRRSGASHGTRACSASSTDRARVSRNSFAAPAASRFGADRVCRVREAWVWAAARAWLRRVSDASAYEARVQDYHRLQQKIEKATEILVSNRAWKIFFGRLDEKTVQSLNAWTRAVDRIGKGTGKHAYRHRRTARQYLMDCVPQHSGVGDAASQALGLGRRACPVSSTRSSWTRHRRRASRPWCCCCSRSALSWWATRNRTALKRSECWRTTSHRLAAGASERVSL